jgi:hypothetical protein
MKRLLLIGAVTALYVLHQDFWFWRTPKPLVFGFLPIGLFYHVLYTLAVAGLLFLMVKYAWPSHLENTDAETRRRGDAVSDPRVAASARPRVNVSREGRTE